MAKRSPTTQYASKQSTAAERRGLYVVGSLAIEQQQVPKRQSHSEQPKIHVVRPKRRQVAEHQVGFIAKFMMICMVLAVLACGLLLVGKLAAISQNNSIIAQKQEELEDLNRYGEQLQVELAMSQDLSSVMVTAKEELGMAAPQQQMRREVVLGTPSDTPETVTAQQQRSGIMAMLGKITGLLH